MCSSLSDRLTQFVQSPKFQERAPHHHRMILLAEKIYGRRKDLELTQTEVAQRAATTQRIISELEDAAYIPQRGIGEDLYDKLAAALEIDRDYLFSEKIERRTFELFAYLGQKLHWEIHLDIMQFMKLPYFLDIKAVKKLGFQLSNFEYVRWQYGPFDKKIYAYQPFFEGKKCVVEFSLIKDFIELIDATIANLPVRNGNKLKKLSYETKPMKKLGATLGGKEAWGERLDLRS